MEHSEDNSSGQQRNRDPSRVGVKVLYLSGLAVDLTSGYHLDVPREAARSRNLDRDRLVKGSPGCSLFRNDEGGAPLFFWGISQPWILHLDRRANTLTATACVCLKACLHTEALLPAAVHHLLSDYSAMKWHLRGYD